MREHRPDALICERPGGVDSRDARVATLLRLVFACSIPGRLRSPAYCARPLTLPGMSGRRWLSPITEKSLIGKNQALTPIVHLSSAARIASTILV